MVKVLVLLLLFINPVMRSQNLVPNPGFEDHETCPKNYIVRYVKELIPGWTLPTRGTPDYFNSCTNLQVGVPQNFMGYCLPKDGQAYAGLILLLDPDNHSRKKTDYREYLQAQLKMPLKKDGIYRVRFYYALAPYSTFAINRLGAVLSVKKIRRRFSTRVLGYKPQIVMDTTLVIETQQWHSAETIFKARGGEKYITIGNFFDDVHTSYKNLDLKGLTSFMQSKIVQNQMAYYYIDLVSVEEILQSSPASNGSPAF